MWLAYIDMFLTLASKVDKSNGHRQEGDELYESTRIEVVGECRAHNRKTQLQRYVGTSLLRHPLYPPSPGLHRTKGESGKLARCICISSSRAKKKRMEDLLKYIIYTEYSACTSVFAFIWVYQLGRFCSAKSGAKENHRPELRP